MTYTFRPAEREQTAVMIGLAGPSSSGKTYSALRMATGLSNGGPVMMIDTEGRRGLHYADQFSFQYCELGAPFRPENYEAALQAGVTAGAKVIIVDSMSHEHEGPGGILEWHEEELTRMAGTDMRRRDAMNFAAWVKPKQAHTKFVNGVLQIGCHLIFCFRAKDKIALRRAGGKTEVVQLGWQPICSSQFEYEMTALLMLPPNGQGVPDPAAAATKLQEQHKRLVPPGKQIDESMGRAFADWAAGGTAPDPLKLAKVAASKGKDTFTAWWNGEGKQHREALRPHLKEIQEVVAAHEDPASAGDGPAPHHPPTRADGRSAPRAGEGAGPSQPDPSDEDAWIAWFATELGECADKVSIQNLWGQSKPARDLISVAGQAELDGIYDRCIAEI